MQFNMMGTILKNLHLPIAAIDKPEFMAQWKKQGLGPAPSTQKCVSISSNNYLIKIYKQLPELEPNDHIPT